MARKLYTLVEKGGLIKEGKIPMQELDSQRGEGAYFHRGGLFSGQYGISKTVNTKIFRQSTFLI